MLNFLFLDLSGHGLDLITDDRRTYNNMIVSELRPLMELLDLSRHLLLFRNMGLHHRHRLIVVMRERRK